MKIKLRYLIDLYNANNQDKRISQRTLAKDVGLSPTTINKLCTNSTTRYDDATLDALIDYFRKALDNPKLDIGDLMER